MRKPRAPYSAAVAVTILNGLAAGRGLRALCRGPGMPTRATVLRWQKERPDFAAHARLARESGRLDRPGRPSGHLDDALIDRLYMRLCSGEPLRTICRDPAMPGRSTVQAWAHRHAAIAHALDTGRNNAAWLRAEAIFEALGGRDCLKPVTPEEAEAHAAAARQHHRRRRRGEPSDPPARVRRGYG